jgi:hypothetical protein
MLLLGLDAPLLEGLAQMLAAVGQRAAIATTVAEAADLAAAEPPLLILVDRSLALASPDALRLPLAPGGAHLLYRKGAEPAAPLPATLQRSVLADLALPLERHRLVALVQHVTDRAAATGRGTRRPPPESRPARP